MEHRGLILLIFGGSLIMSPIAINIATGQDQSQQSASYLETQNGTNSTCVDATVLLMGNELNCRPPSTIARSGNDATRRVMEGGAVFLSARR